MVLHSLLLTVASKMNDFCYFLYKAADLSVKTRRCIYTQAVAERRFILVKNWEQMSDKGDGKMVKKGLCVRTLPIPGDTAALPTTQKQTPKCGDKEIRPEGKKGKPANCCAQSSQPRQHQVLDVV